MHGKQSQIQIKEGSRLFQGPPSVIEAARYHSLVVSESDLPEDLQVVARDCEQGEVMAVEHRDYPVYGLQFHPESILTPEGRRILENFIAL